MGLFTKVFGTYSQRELKSIYPIVDKITALEDEYRQLTDAELQAKTPEFKERLANGETLDDILPEAFAAVREAADRVLGMRPYPVQLVGGIVLHQGRIAEMKTGEGKTLVATLPAYLNALTGEGVHIVTVNDYLAKRDSEWMGKVHRFMGLTVGLIIHDMKKEERQKAYQADITYGTNNEMGFDYLRDNMALYANEQVQRGHALDIYIYFVLFIQYFCQFSQCFFTSFVEFGAPGLEQQLIGHGHIYFSVLLAYSQFVVAEAEQCILYAVKQILYFGILLVNHSLEFLNGFLTFI